MASFRRKKGIKIGRVVSKIAVTVIALYVGGVIMTELGTVMSGTESPFYTGLSLIGWTVGAYPAFNASHQAVDCANTSVGAAGGTVGETCITLTTGSGILSVIGIIGIAAIVMEFVEIKF